MSLNTNFMAMAQPKECVIKYEKRSLTAMSGIFTNDLKHESHWACDVDEVQIFILLNCIFSIYEDITADKAYRSF